jgi:7-cyano-7-deazaguanine synthase in queuosine biosynthesis
VDKRVAPWSAGLDSTFMVVRLLENNYEVYPIYVNFNTISSKYEVNSLINLSKILRERFKTLHEVKIFEVKGEVHSPLTDGLVPKLFLEYYKNKKSENITLMEFYFPVRNLIVLSISVAYAESEGINTVSFATSKTDQESMRDLSIDFIKSLNDMLSHITPVRVETPISSFSREEIWIGLRDLGLLDYTFSCNKPVHGVCGSCSHCLFDKRMRIGTCISSRC